MTALRMSERSWIEICERVRALEAELTALRGRYADLLVQMGDAVKP